MSHLNRHQVLVLALCLVQGTSFLTLSAQAQPAPETGEPAADDAATAPQTAEADATPPTEDTDVAEAPVPAAEPAGEEEVAATFINPEPEATTSAATAAATVAEEEPEDSESLLPAGDAAINGSHDVDETTIRFRPGKGVEITSADDMFRLQIRVRGQFRYTLRGDDGELDHQFRARRVRAVFSGHFFGEDNRFKLELAVAPNDLGMADNFSDDGFDNIPSRSPMLDLYFEFRQLRDLSLRIGQYKLPSNRQRVISSGNLQLVDRSIVNSEFTLDRDVGFDLRSRDFLGLGLLRYYAGVSIGRGRDSQGFDDFGLNYFVRVEVLPFGMFRDYSEVDFERSFDPRLSIGAVYAYQDRNRGLRRISSRLPADGGTTDYHIFMADAIFKYAGFSAQWEFALRSGSRNPGGALGGMGTPPDARNGWGQMFQAGYLFPRTNWEIAARYGMVRSVDFGEGTSLGDGNEAGFGVSYYFARHPFKLQADIFQLWGDEGFGDGRTQFRIQLQAGL